MGENAAGVAMLARLSARGVAHDDGREALARHVGQLLRSDRLRLGAGIFASCRARGLALDSPASGRWNDPAWIDVSRYRTTGLWGVRRCSEMVFSTASAFS